MSQMPKVTVITPVYNLFYAKRESFFRQCMSSVHEQDYPSVEHIVVDGMSSDGTDALVKEYENKGWCKLVRKLDAGIDDAYNHGLEVAEGKYVFFMNSDDYYFSRDSLSKCVDGLEKQSADFCYGSEQKIDRTGKKIFYWQPKIESFWHDMPFSHQTMGVRRDVLVKLGGYDTSFGYGGDYRLVIDLITNDYKGVQINSTISVYRLGGISSQQTDLAQVNKTIQILGKRIEDFSSNFIDIDLDDAIRIYLEARRNPFVFPPKYISKMVRYMVNKNLVNFNYNEFIAYVTKLSSPPPPFWSKKKVLFI